MKQYKVTGQITFRFTARVHALDTDHADDAIADAMASGNFEIDDMIDYEVDFDGLEPESDPDAPIGNDHVHPTMRGVLPW